MPSAFSKEYDFKLAKEAGLPVDRWPESEEEVKRVEDLLAADLAKLSLDEHEKALYDIHGITDVEEETPAMISARLDELQMELDQIESKEAYNLALNMNPEYVQSRSFRLLFLRGEQYGVKAAAKMIVSHFDAKRMYFGSGEILAREVYQSDLSEIDMLILRSGSQQVLSMGDASGRAILFLTIGTVDKFPEGTIMNECRILWYQTMAMLRNEEIQKRGSVFLIMALTSSKMTVESFMLKLNLSRCLPSEPMCGHFCYNDPDLTPFVRGFHLMIPEHHRYRLRIHFGNRDELDSTLETYGIPSEAIPLKKDGSLQIEYYLAWLDMLREQEERAVAPKVMVASLNPKHTRQDSVACIYTPRRFDVLFGKSILAREHTGTRRALHMVEMRYEDYERARGKFQKTDIAERVISTVHDSGGRFLKKNEDGTWMEVPEVESKRKIAHWFRHARSKRKVVFEQESIPETENAPRLL